MSYQTARIHVADSEALALSSNAVSGISWRVDVRLRRWFWTQRCYRELRRLCHAEPGMTPATCRRIADRLASEETRDGQAWMHPVAAARREQSCWDLRF